MIFLSFKQEPDCLNQYKKVVKLLIKIGGEIPP